MLKKLLLSIAMLVMFVGLQVSSQAAETIKIGVAFKNLSDQFVKNIADAVEARGNDYDNVELIVVDARGDIVTQLSQIENFISQGVDAIILNAQDAAGLSPAVDRAKEAGIPVVECNTLTTNPNYDIYVGSDDVEAGKIQGKYVNKLLPDGGNIIILHGPMGQSPEIKRREGIQQELLDKNPKIKVLAEQTAEWKRDKAMSITEDMIQAFDNINLICAQNDDMAMGALSAVDAAGLSEKIKIVGIDAIPDALEAVKEGKLACTVFQDAKGQGSTSVDMAVKLAKGEKVEKNAMIPFILVTAENADEFMHKNAQ